MSRESDLQAVITRLRPPAKFTGDGSPWDGHSTNTARVGSYPAEVQSPDGRDYAQALSEIFSLELLVADLRARVTILENA